jgi:DNA invertase Pin-like site-specific DNA recombinase
VSTDKQAQEGVSLEAQEVRIRAYCVSQNIELLDVIVDDGASAKSLDRPGLKRALSLLSAGHAQALVIVKLDRLTRSVKDLGYLCDTYFREGMHSLVSVSDTIDTRSASGKLMLNVLMSVAQWEREAVSERTQEAMDQLARQGVKMGAPPYGWRYAERKTENDRRELQQDPSEQAIIARIVQMRKDGVRVTHIARRLNQEGVPSRGVLWRHLTVYKVLARAGMHTFKRTGPRKATSDSTRDRSLAITQAHAFRRAGLSLRAIGAKLLEQKILPTRGKTWHAASVLDLLRQAAE